MSDDRTARIYAELLENLNVATEYLRSTGRVPNEEDFERIASAFDDACRFLVDETRDVPPDWLIAVGGLMQVILANFRYARAASENYAGPSLPKKRPKDRKR
jgi:hypothetical protein